MYAANESDVLNASVEFDEQTLRPTYRLLVGFAGSSSGLEIARRFGIPDDVIKDAATQLKQSSLDAIDYLRRIKREAEEAEAQRQALEEERAATAEKFAALDREFDARERDRRAEFDAALKRSVTDFENLTRELLTRIEDRAARVKVEREAEKRAAELKREAQRAAQAMSQAARTETPSRVTRGREKSLPPKLRGVRVMRDGQVVSDVEGEPIQKPETPLVKDDVRDVRAPRVEARAFKIGDRVKTKLGSIGIIDRLKGEEAELRVGSLHMREKLANLDLIAERAGPTVGDSSLERMKKRAATELHLHSKEPDSKFQSSNELNLIGRTTDEAADLVDKFLDAAFLDGQLEVRIIHGHGTGALRKAIAELLAGHPHVERFNAARQDQGGSGATQVYLRQ
jgi:DNA mismatch repair protein MutS2